MKKTKITNHKKSSLKIDVIRIERIDVIREEIKELSCKLSKGELKEIKNNLYKIENKKGLLE